MAATRKKQISWWSGDALAVRPGKITASQGAYIFNTPCYLSTTAGRLTVCLTSASGHQTLHGFLLNSPASAQAADTVVYYADASSAPNALYAVHCETSGTDAAAATTLKGGEYGMTVSTTAGEVGYTTLDTGNSSDMFHVVDVISEAGALTTPDWPAAATAPGIALVRIISTVLQSADNDS